jgi:hypothetical protein
VPGCDQPCRFLASLGFPFLILLSSGVKEIQDLLTPPALPLWGKCLFWRGILAPPPGPLLGPPVYPVPVSHTGLRIRIANGPRDMASG